MNDISDLSTFDLPEIGIKSLREYQDIEHYKDKGLDSLLLQTRDNNLIQLADAPPSYDFLQVESQLSPKVASQWPHGTFGTILHALTLGLFGG